MKKLLSNLPNLLKLTYQGWKEDKASRLSAALAYYTIFSLAPMLLIIIAVTGFFFGQREIVQTQVMNQIEGLVGAEGKAFVSDLLTSASNPAKGIVATIVGIITLLFGALGVFNELHNALNTIWEVREEETKGFVESIKKVIFSRLLSFSMILGIGFLLLVSLVISAALSAVQETIGNAIPISEILLQLVNLVISIVVITVLFALIFKVPARRRDRLARRLAGSFCDGRAVFSGEVLNWHLSGQQHSHILLRGGWLVGTTAALDLLLRADPVVWRRIHRGLRKPVWLEDHAGRRRSDFADYSRSPAWAKTCQRVPATVGQTGRGCNYNP